jgi:hypothetical protein
VQQLVQLLKVAKTLLQLPLTLLLKLLEAFQSALKDVSYAVNTVAETYDGVITTVVENIDKQTDELQDKPEESIIWMY